MTQLYWPFVKTAISLPDHLFEAGDRLARRLGISRSELYARALENYLAGADDVDVTRLLDAVLADVDTSVDSDLAAAQREVLLRTDP